MIDIEISEEKIIEALTGSEDIKYAASYQGEIMNIEKKLTMPIPAALVVYGGAQPQMMDDKAGARGSLSVSFSVFVISKNLRGKAQASADVRRALKVVRERLNGLKIISGRLERTLLWQSEQFNFMNSSGVCGYEQVYQYTDYL